VQGGVSPAAIIETLDVLKRTASGLCSRLKGRPFDAFAFEAMEETLHRRVIVAVGSAAHANDHAFLL
jgi:hypothetical protein